MACLIISYACACFSALTNQHIMQAKMLIGATLLVTEEDKPELEEGEFYTHDLNGMRVFMKVCANHESCVHVLVKRRTTLLLVCRFNFFSNITLKLNKFSFLCQLFFFYILWSLINLVILPGELL